VSSGGETFFAGFMDEYFAECDEHLVNIRRHLLAVESAADGGAIDRDILEDMFRSFHSIKGISGMVELREAELLAHQMESYLRVLRSGEAGLGAEGVDALIDGVDLLERIVAARRDGTALPPAETTLAKLRAVISDARPAVSLEAEAPVVQPTWRVEFAASPDLVARGINVDSVRARLRAAGTIVDAVPKVLPDGIAFEFSLAADLDDPTLAAWRADGMRVEPIVPAESALPSEPAGGSARAVQPSHVVRVDLTRLDDLMRIIGDLVIARSRLDESLRRVARHVPPVEWRGVQENALTIERQLRDLREGIMRVRLVPVSEIFRRMPFVVRDLARESGKKVRLDLEGQDTEIDKFLIERMLDPVLHLVRNAVSHGFETPEQRLEAGKPAEGTLRLSAAGVGDRVVLEVADDGRGVDPERVAERARQAGLHLPPGPLDDAALLEVICTPGFSTRDETDRASGRGVGMSVVKNTIQELNGSLAMQTVKGEGTRYIIELPLTLSIADALIARVGDRTFAVPQSAVREVVEVDLSVLRPVGQQEIAPFRGGVLPILRLSRLFGIEAAARERLHVFVIGSGNDGVGLAVDRIVGQREIVVRTMADTLVRVDGIVGATDLGDGRVVLILDPVALARRGHDAEALQP
jgi:two-component system chemotaxis sensor kinase CheA